MEENETQGTCLVGRIKTAMKQAFKGPLAEKVLDLSNNFPWPSLSNTYLTFLKLVILNSNDLVIVNYCYFFPENSHVAPHKAELWL